MSENATLSSTLRWRNVKAQQSATILDSCLSKKLEQENHLIIMTSSFSKSSVCRPHKSKDRVFKFLWFEERYFSHLGAWGRMESGNIPESGVDGDFCLRAIRLSLPCKGTYYTRHQAPRAQRHFELSQCQLQRFQSNLVLRAHVPFGQHQDTELWNNQFPETKILGLPASQRMRGLVEMASRDKADVDTFHKCIQYALEKLGKSNSGFERTVVPKFKSKRRVGSGNELVETGLKNR